MNVLFVVSADFGELGNAMYFACGNRDSFTAHLLLPAGCEGRLPPSDDYSLGYYASLAGILQAVEQHKADVVLLFSGYLLTIDQRLTLFTLYRLLQQLAQRGIPVATSDPFLGQLSRARELSLSRLTAGAEPSLRSWLWATELKQGFRILHRCLRSLPHFYPAADPARAWCFYNRNWPGALLASARGSAVQTTIPHSLYVLSEADLRLLENERGLSTFSQQLLLHLQRAAAAGYHPALVAPARLAQSMAAEARGPLPCQCFSNLSFPVYMHMLDQAPLVFYWNYFSFSVLSRILSQKPAFFFHQGHMADIMPGLLEEGIALFYQHWQPPLLVLEAPPDKARMENLAAQFVVNAHRIHQALERSPSPAELMARLSRTRGNTA